MEIHILRVGFELRYQTEQVNLLPIWLTINIYAAICFDLIILPMFVVHDVWRVIVISIYFANLNL